MEWLSAREADALVGGGKWLGNGARAICRRAHAGLLKARASLLIVGDQSTDAADIDHKFWWAEGRVALHQDWRSGDFSTWIDNVEWKALGVEFEQDGIMAIARMAPDRAQAATATLSGEPGQKPERVVVMSTGLALRECADWLRERFQDEGTASWAKPVFRTAALEKFDGRLSGRGFDQAWNTAVKDFPDRTKRGAKPKSKQPIQIGNI